MHTGNREFSCPHCTQRFGRKDHMTRHAKKTHASLYPGSGGGERLRVVSGPEQQQHSRPTRSGRKERSVSEPGPGRGGEESRGKTVGEPRAVIVHSSSSSSSSSSGRVGESSSGSSVITSLYQPNIIYSSPLDNIQEKQDSPPVRDFQRLMTMDNDQMIIKEEEPYFTENMEQEGSDIKELLDDKDRIDLHSFMEEFAEKKIFLGPAATQQIEEEHLLRTNFSGGLVKMEPSSRPASPAPASLIEEEQYGSTGAHHLPHHLPPLIHLEPPQQPLHCLKARNVLLRTQSQDSITRTKNPVLPSIHAETCLVVPEPNQVKYPAGSGQLLFGFSEDREEQFTELRGSLFLSEDYTQSYFQPWNN